MFCTNCGEQMRDTDKFCANCGAAAAPRASKLRSAPPVPPEASAPTPSQSTANFHAPLPTTTSSRTGNATPEPGFSARTSQEAPAPAPTLPLKQPAPATPGAQAPLSRQQEQQVLLEAEEIASVRGMTPVDALPPEFPPAPAADKLTCRFCGAPNPAINQFCERCGQRIQSAAAVQPAPAAAQISHGGWLEVPEPARRPGSAPVKAPVARKAATAPAPPVAPASGKEEDFFYFYDDKSPQRSNLKLLIVLMVVLALGVLGVIYLLSRPSAKSPSGGNVAITISPTEAQVVAGEAHDFSATVTGSGDTDVTWSVAEGSGGGNVVNRGAQAQGGAVASLGVYVAPGTPGTYHVVATSKADTTKSATAEVLVSGK